MISSLCLLVIWQHVWAQKDTGKSSLDEVVVTATKSPKKLSETGKVVTVITREQIEQSVGKNLSQLLNEQTGITVNGAVSNEGKDKSLYLRGASDRYTLILLDGIALNDPSGVGEIGVQFEGGFEMRFGFAGEGVGSEGGSVGGVDFGRVGIEVEGGFELKFGGVEWGIAGEE